MSNLIDNVVQITICSGILYANYHLLLRNKKFHLYNRYYLLASVVLSILVPFVNIPIYFAEPAGQSSAILQTLTDISSVTNHKHFRVPVADRTHANIFTLENILTCSYVLIASAVIFRLLTAFLFIRKLLRKYKVQRQAHIHFVNTAEPGTPFSFFKWLFWNNKIDLRSENGRQMFRHELFHIQQRHSWDLTFMEIATAVFWINPFFHVIKKELTTIHEFLADEFATREKDKWSYAELLLLQVLGTSRNRLVNAFFHNQIKRRIAMITSSKTPKYQFFRKLMILPVSVLVFALFAFKIERHAQFKFARFKPVNAPTNFGPVPKFVTFAYVPLADTTKPKAKKKAKSNVKQEQVNGKKIENDNEAMEFKLLMEEKQLEMQKAQQEFQQRMMENQRETQATQEQFREMMEARQRQAEQEGQEKFKQLMEERQKQAEKYEEEFKKMLAMKQHDAEKNQEEFRKMMEGRQRQAEHEGQERFKQLMEEKQKEAQKFQKEFNQMMMMKQREAEKSQEEFRKLLEKRQQEMKKMQEEFQKKMLEK
ncbi:MAG TPA: M56 family metallopeptidase, partial [Chitinophagaceae bacterium]|nr:M56 family metallopeptidase [Chitinophagaceae bacterium]